jgi:putative protease
LNNSRLNRKVIKSKNKLVINPKNHDAISPILTVEVSNQSQYDFVKSLGITNIYFKNIVRRNNATYIDDANEVLVGGLSSLNYYKNKDIILVSDYSFNVNNHISAAMLSSFGVERITLSSELNEEQINNLVDKYILTYNTHPNLELIIYGRASLMHSKYCPLRRLNMCGECKTNKFALKDNFEAFPLKFNDDCTINLLNSKTLNLIDDIKSIRGVNYFRLVFTTEDNEEIKDVIESASLAIKGQLNKKCFKGNTQTRGNFKKTLL